MDQQTVKLLLAEAKRWYKTYEANAKVYGRNSPSALTRDEWEHTVEFLEAHLDGT